MPIHSKCRGLVHPINHGTGRYESDSWWCNTCGKFVEDNDLFNFDSLSSSEENAVRALLNMLEGKCHIKDQEVHYSGPFIEYRFTIQYYEKDPKAIRPSVHELYERVACLLMDRAKLLKR